MEWVNQFISPSKLDMFAKYKSGWEYQLGESEKEFTTEAFIDKLLRLESPANFIKAEAGTAVHKLIELAQYGDIENAYKVNDWLIEIPSNINFNIHVPLMREIGVNGIIAGVPIRGRVDSIDGIAVHDIKTTSQVNIDNYINSYQWKCYLLLAKLNNFVYDIIKVSIKEDIQKITIVDYVKLELCSYAEMRKEVEDIVFEYQTTLIALSPRIIERVQDYNVQLNTLVSVLEHSLTWAHTANHDIIVAINKIKSKILNIKGINA